MQLIHLIAWEIDGRTDAARAVFVGYVTAVDFEDFLRVRD